MRGVTLTDVSTHLIHSAAFGPYHKSEMRHAKELLSSIPEASLTAFDKGFFSAEILCGLITHGNHRHFVIPAKVNTKWEVLEGSAGDVLVQMRTSPLARRQCPELPEFWQARAITVVDTGARK